MKPKVLVSVPNQMWIHKWVVGSLMLMAKDTKGTEVNFILPSHRPLENNQAHIMKDFLVGDFDFWVSIDSDNPPTKNPLSLVHLNLDIIGCPTPVLHINPEKPKDWPIYWNAMDDKVEGGKWVGWKPHVPCQGLQEVDAVGGGCWVIARRVLQTLKDKMPFQRTWNPDGTVEIGNDFSFCRKAKSEGFKVFTHFDYPCRHFNEVELTEVQEAFVNAIWH